MDSTDPLLSKISKSTFHLQKNNIHSPYLEDQYRTSQKNLTISLLPKSNYQVPKCRMSPKYPKNFRPPEFP